MIDTGAVFNRSLPAPALELDPVGYGQAILSLVCSSVDRSLSIQALGSSTPAPQRHIGPPPSLAGEDGSHPSESAFGACLFLSIALHCGLTTNPGSERPHRCANGVGHGRNERSGAWRGGRPAGRRAVILLLARGRRGPGPPRSSDARVMGWDGLRPGFGRLGWIDSVGPSQLESLSITTGHASPSSMPQPSRAASARRPVGPITTPQHNTAVTYLPPPLHPIPPENRRPQAPPKNETCAPSSSSPCWPASRSPAPLCPAPRCPKRRPWPCAPSWRPSSGARVSGHVYVYLYVYGHRPMLGFCVC